MTRPYLPLADSHAAKIIEALRDKPPGSRVTRTDARLFLGLPGTIEPRRAVAAGFLVYHPPDFGTGAPAAWTLGRPCPSFLPNNRQPTDRRSREERRHQERREEPPPLAVTPELFGRLRAVMFDGLDIESGDPVMLLAEARQAAQQVLAHKGAGRFSGAEVEAFVARELRAVSEAAARARDNLRQALEVTL